ncbi:hypothetical protein E2562_027229 [Oryza meyeriana var. granulata]|uniref:Uncharacterized protein n=1 Tax=Oryza meyeriana var. granulata TaxID=110450 RepID=A0A6G1D8B1_9ORYZ|nr:hypothetical protein E2562_027229 [Oryza meyeriana var. granulata]
MALGVKFMASELMEDMAAPIDSEEVATTTDSEDMAMMDANDQATMMDSTMSSTYLIDSLASETEAEYSLAGSYGHGDFDNN